MNCGNHYLSLVMVEVACGVILFAVLQLNQKLAQDEKCHIVRILDYFMYQRHLCISFEMLGSNL